MQSLEEEIIVLLVWMGMFVLQLFDNFEKKTADSNCNTKFLNVYAFINILMALSKVTEL